MIEKKTFEKLMNKLDSQIFKIQVSHPVPSPTELPYSVGLIINEDTNISQLPENQLPLAHTMLHMFYQNKSGKGLSDKNLEKLHKGVIKRLENHKKFDKLDD